MKILRIISRMPHQRPRGRGFTLIEVLAVVGVSTVGLFGVSSLVIQNIQAQNINRHYPVAAMLAQEGFELVRNQRDNNWLRGAMDTEWKYGGAAGRNIVIAPDLSYIIDPTDFQPPLVAFDSDADDLTHSDTVLKSDAEGFYDHISASSTVYRRLIEIDDIAPESIEVTVTVIWMNRDRPFKYTLRSLLYDWR